MRPLSDRGDMQIVKRAGKSISVKRGNWVPELSYTFDFDFDHVSRLHEYLRVSDEADTRRSTCGDHIADFEGHHFRDIRDQIRHFENHIPRIRLLHRVPVQPKFDIHSVSIVQSVWSDQVRPYWRKSIE